jgi:predicted lipase
MNKSYKKGDVIRVIEKKRSSQMWPYQFTLQSMEFGLLTKEEYNYIIENYPKHVKMVKMKKQMKRILK